MSGITTVNSFPIYLRTFMGESFGLDYKAHTKVGPEIFEVESSDGYLEEKVELRGMGPARQKAEGDIMELDSMGQGNVRITTHTVWGKRARVTHEAIADGRGLKHAPMISKEFARNLVVTEETNAAAFLNNATSTTGIYAGLDGKALLATDHPLGNGNTSSNTPTVACPLSETALEQARIDISRFLGSSGEKIVVKPLKLVIPNELEFDAHRIIKSNLQAFTADNTANAIKDKGLYQNILTWTYLTDLDSWFIVTDEPGMVMYNRESPKLIHTSDELAMCENFAMVQRYSHDFYNWRHIYGCMGP